MKKDYLTPEAVNVTLETAPVMTTTSGEQENVGTGSGSAGNGTPDFSAGKREDWGNLWK